MVCLNEILALAYARNRVLRFRAGHAQQKGSLRLWRRAWEPRAHASCALCVHGGAIFFREKGKTRALLSGSTIEGGVSPGVRRRQETRETWEDCTRVQNGLRLNKDCGKSANMPTEATRKSRRKGGKSANRWTSFRKGLATQKHRCLLETRFAREDGLLGEAGGKGQ